MQVVDIHSHFFPKEWPSLQEKFGGNDWPWLQHLPNEKNESGFAKAMLMKGDKPFRPIYAACWDPEIRLAEMDAQGVSQQIISATPILFAYEKPLEQAVYCAQIFNDAALEICQQGKGRLFSMAQVPLQDADAACEEASRAMNTGHVGIQIGNHVGEKNMDDEGVLTFLQHCAAENIPVFVHPWDMMAASRTKDYMMGWTVGMPAETQLSIVSMILGGGFDRISRDLKICFAHGGGAFAFLLGRLENAWLHRDIARGKSEYPPSHYLDRFYLDTAVFDHDALELLVKKMTTDRLLFGTDYPFPLGEQKMGALIKTAPNLSDAKKQQMLATNAQLFFSLPTC
ncbi:amidohydrolase family protein [Thalassotalea sp. PP2-459]|uniref:amidohydrolase family protein n=1 Tax=Thalassotalea sp. PP2-459 TaxID=1742724 RepID=UPI0009446844|nr:amidohydrolase family protein [Thalassotalea sp. PP2-459]OKY26767.1 aminocarboxymuconate-semialdehyde decarboxylase [Thalassotalea sp. PP2-459]